MDKNLLKRSPGNCESKREKKLCLHEGEDVQETVERERDTLLQTSAKDAGQFDLSLFPNEILLEIYENLTPADLMSIVQLNNKRLTELTYTVRQANFSACRKADPAFLSSFFSRDRVKLLQKLNFNYYFYLKPQELTNFICRCKNLKSLSVVGCQLDFTKISKILQSCKQLETLAWNMTRIPKENNLCFSNLKKMYLFGDSIFPLGKISLLKIFPGMEQAWMDFDHDTNNSAVPFLGIWSASHSLSNDEKSKHLIMTASWENMYSSPSWTAFVQGESVLLDISKKLFKENNHRNQTSPMRLLRSLVNIPPYLQLRSNIGDAQSVSFSPSKVYSTIVIDVVDEFLEVSESLIKCVHEISGDKLKHLSFLVHDFERSRIESGFATAEEYVTNCDKICDAMEQIFLTSKYITVLNLTTIHFSTNSPIKSITQLKHLKVLNLPSCAFTSNIRKNDSENLTSVVSACDNIVEFVLYCCSESASVITSGDIVCIQNWSQLKHLCIIYSNVLRSFAFLQKVADSCIQLSSLTLIALPSSSASLFTNDVIYLLKKAKNLRLIRINDVNFNPMFERFWPAIGEAVGLEGICITTKSGVYVNTRVVVDEIKKLKYLHLFHFHANLPQRFFKEVQKSMQAQNIQNITIEDTCLLPDTVMRCYDSRPVKIYHKRPYISECLGLHLKDIDLF